MPIVLDASISASWHFPDEASEPADTVLKGLEEDSALVPVHWWFEIRNVLLIGERRGRASRVQTATFLEWLAELPIRNAPLPNGAEVLELARKHALTFSDAAYLELAQRERIPLATLNQPLARAALAEGVALLAD